MQKRKGSNFSISTDPGWRRGRRVYSEVLGPVYENVYVKSMILFEGEELRYYFVESGEKSEIRTEKAVCRKVDRQKEIGKYMRINQLIREGQKQELIENFAEEEQMSELLFPIY